MTPSESTNAIAWKVLDPAEGNALVSPLGLYNVLKDLEAGTTPESPAGKALREILGPAAPAPPYWEESTFRCSNLLVINSASAGKVRQDYIDTLMKKLKHECTVGDLTKDLDYVKGLVTRWVAEKTEGMIYSYQPSFRESTSLAVFNALHLSCRWDIGGFLYDRAPFRTSSGKEYMVKMMHRNFMRIRFVDDGFYRAVFIPLRSDIGSETQGGMAIIMPSDGSVSMAELWAKENPAYRSRFMSSLLDAPWFRAEVVFPAFTVRAETPLPEMLRRIGLYDALCVEGMDAIGTDAKAYVSDGKQQCVLEADEDGIEAAGVTEADVVLGCAPNPVKVMEFVCGVPFVFAVCDRVSGTMIFAGKVDEPPEYREE